jgi:hypothetical protein
MTVAILWSVWHDPKSPQFIPEWVEMFAGPLIITLPLSLLVHLLTKKIGGAKSRMLDLMILLAVVGVYWVLSSNLKASGLVRSPFLFWLRLTLTSWATLFLPFNATLALVDGWKSRQKSVLAPS